MLNYEFKLLISVVEIYQEDVYDLLNNSKIVPIKGFGFAKKSSYQLTNPGCSWIDKPKDKSMYEIKGTTELPINNISDLNNIMKTIEISRSSKSHDLNERSSRSHCIVTLTKIDKYNNKFLFVDLAGSERIFKSNSTGLKETEAKSINSSLSSLTRCLNCLRLKNSFIPWRDSSLTMLMKESLSSCITSLIINIYENIENTPETISSLRFGNSITGISIKNIESKENNTD